jgi:hypothetical protein
MARVFRVQLESKIIHDLCNIKWKIRDPVIMKSMAYHITKVSTQDRGWRFSTKLPEAKPLVPKSEIAILLRKLACKIEPDISVRAPIVLCYVFVHGRGVGSAIAQS